MKNKKSILKNILIGVLVLILIIAAAAVMGYQFYLKPKIIEPIKQITQAEGVDASALSQQTLLEQLEETLQDEEVRSYIDRNAPGETNELLSIIDSVKQGQSLPSPEATEPSAWTKPIDPYSPIVKPTPEPTPLSTPMPTPEPKATSKYDYLKSKVAPDDFSAAVALAGKVDPGYILGLVSGGLTVEEKRELKSYLMSRLSSSEISNGIRLFAKYSYLLG